MVVTIQLYTMDQDRIKMITDYTDRTADEYTLTKQREISAAGSRFGISSAFPKILCPACNIARRL